MMDRGGKITHDGRRHRIQNKQGQAILDFLNSQGNIEVFKGQVLGSNGSAPTTSIFGGPPGGTAALPSFAFTGPGLEDRTGTIAGANDLGMYRIAANRLGFSTSGVLALEIGASGQVLATPSALSATPGITAGGIFNIATSTFTDNATAGSGTAAAFAAYGFIAPTLAASNTSVTTTDSATVYINNAPVAGTNETLTNRYALWIDAGGMRIDGTTNPMIIVQNSREQVQIGMGVTTTASSMVIIGGAARTLLTTLASASGMLLDIGNAVTITAASGQSTPIAVTAVMYMGIVTYAFAAAATMTDSATLWINGAPAAGTNATLTRTAAMIVAAGISRFVGNVVHSSATTQPQHSTAGTQVDTFEGGGTAPSGAATNSSSIYASTTALRKIIAAGTDSLIET